MKALVRLGNYISTERNFLRVSFLGLGAPAAVIGVWAISGYGALVALVTAVLAFIGAYVWGLIMWRLVFRGIYARVQALKETADAAAPAERGNS